MEPENEKPAATTATAAAAAGEGDHDTGKKSSSSSDSSFDEDFFLLDETEHASRKSSVGTAADFLQLDEHGRFVSDVGSHPPSSPDASVATPDFDLSSKSLKQTPQIQVMERSEDPDPNRIPSTVFARTKSTAPVEWSVASNESLFSIHMGNNSFSRDQIFLLSKSQELGRPDDMFKFPNAKSVETTNAPITKSRELTSGSNTPAPATPTTKSTELGVAEAAAETMKDVLRVTEEKAPADGVRVSASISPRSSGSGGSVVSFAFPILTKEGTKSVKVDAGSISKKKKTDPEQQQLKDSQPQTPTSAGAGAKWFSCFSCSFCR